MTVWNAFQFGNSVAFWMGEKKKNNKKKKMNMYTSLFGREENKKIKRLARQKQISKAKLV